MMEKSQIIKYWMLKVLSIVVSCGFPIYAVIEHFPIWSVRFGIGKTFGAGGIICIIVLFIIFRKTVFNFVKDRMNLKYAPPITAWIIALIVSYILIYITTFIQYLTTVFWMGLLGGAIGTMLTWVAENKLGSRKENNDGQSGKN